MAYVTLSDQYMILLAITLIFTVLALIFDEENWKKVTLQWFSGITWIVSAFANFLVGDTTNFITIPLTYLFISFGIVFVIVGFYNSIQAMKTKGGV